MVNTITQQILNELIKDIDFYGNNLSQGDIMRKYPFIVSYNEYEHICLCNRYLTLEKLNTILSTNKNKWRLKTTIFIKM